MSTAFKTKPNQKENMRKGRMRRRGFKLKMILKWAITFVPSRKRRTSSYQQQLDPPPVTIRSSTAMSTLRHWASSIKRSLCFTRSSYIRMGTKNHHQLTMDDPNPELLVPKGHLAVYVGDNSQRFLVPVIHFNHPLFGDLLKETEDKFGYDFPGGIQIPCPVSDFQKVQTTIAATHSSSQRFTWLHR